MKFKTVSMLMLAGSAGLATGPVSASALDDVVAGGCSVIPCARGEDQGGVGIIPDPTKLAKWRGADVERINTFRLHTGTVNEAEYALIIVKLNSVRSDSSTAAAMEAAQPYEFYSPITGGFE